jgi:hypothetical protein
MIAVNSIEIVIPALIITIIIPLFIVLASKDTSYFPWKVKLRNRNKT